MQRPSGRRGCTGTPSNRRGNRSTTAPQTLEEGDGEAARESRTNPRGEGAGDVEGDHMKVLEQRERPWRRWRRRGRGLGLARGAGGGNERRIDAEEKEQRRKGSSRVC